MNKRYIKNESQTNFNPKQFKNKEITTVPKGSKMLHPITGDWINAKDGPICMTKINLINKNKFTHIIPDKDCGNNKELYKQYLLIPPIGFASDIILQLYDINSIDDVLNFIENNKNFYTANRIVVCWIRNNFDTLKMYNNILEKICIKLSNNNIKDNIDINKEAKYFVDYWVAKHTSIEFELDLVNDFINYLAKKYN
jgi:hypothetical protein